jgi:cytochrome c biogenesis protein CcmG/thiol:disulfide interchange protein DsbE
MNKLLICLIFLAFTFPQDKIANVFLKDINGKTVSILEATKNPDGPTVISFWAIWCKPCIQEMDNVQDELPAWKEETKVKWVSVSVDDSRTSSKVGAFAKGRGWTYDILLDENGDLKRSLNIPSVPHTIVLDTLGNIVWQHNSYQPGDEDELHEVLLKYSKKK